MSSTIDTLFGPLGKNYCIYFYILSVFGLIAALILLISSLVIGIVNKKDPAFFLQSLMMVLAYGLIYFQNRLLYNMCAGSL